MIFLYLSLSSSFLKRNHGKSADSRLSLSGHVWLSACLYFVSAIDPAGQEQGRVLSFEQHQTETQAETPPWHLGNRPARARNIRQQSARQVAAQVVRFYKHLILAPSTDPLMEPSEEKSSFLSCSDRQALILLTYLARGNTVASMHTEVSTYF